MISKIKRIKIAYLLKTFPKISETFILTEIIALERKGIEIQIFSLQRPTDSKFHPAVKDVRSKVIYIPSFFSKNIFTIFKAHFDLFFDNTKRYLSAIRFLASKKEGANLKEFSQAGYLAMMINGLEISHLHAHFANYPAGVAELVHIMSGTSYSITGHAKDIYLSSPEVLERKMNSAEFTVTCTEYNKQFLENISTNGNNVHRIYHGLNMERFCPVDSGNKLTSETIPTILSIGRFREKKGFPYLIHTCKILMEQGYKINCKIVGYGPLYGEIKQLISDLGLDQVVFLVEKLVQEQVIELYSKATIFVLPCQIADDGDRDGIPNVLLEAMAMRLPVISTDISGIAELIEHMETGILVPQKDTEALVSAVKLLLDQPHLRSKLGKTGRAKVCKQFSLEKSAEKLKDLFVNL